MKTLATSKRLDWLIENHYENAVASPHASAYRLGWHAAQGNQSRDSCPYSNVYDLEYGGFDKASNVKMYIHWHYGYDAYLFWSQPKPKHLTQILCDHENALQNELGDIYCPDCNRLWSE